MNHELWYDVYDMHVARRGKAKEGKGVPYGMRSHCGAAEACQSGASV